MSYTKRFHEKVSGEVTVYYTVSQNTAPGRYSETVRYDQDVDIAITVDTDPFDRSARNCASSMGNLGNSVVIAGSAEAASKLANATKVGNTVVKGFFGLVEQNFRVQAVEEQAILGAVAGELIEQGKELNRKKEVMTGDYNRIKGRYLDLFTDLNNELHTRIVNLIKPCFLFVEKSSEELNRNLCSSLSAVAMIGHKENIGLQARLSSARMKSRASALIRASQQFLMGQRRLSKQIEDMVVNKDAEGDIFIPVVYIGKHQPDNSMSLEVIVPQEAHGVANYMQQLKEGIQRSSCLNSKMEEAHHKYISERLEKRIERTTGTDAHSKRIADTMRALYGKANF